MSADLARIQRACTKVLGELDRVCRDLDINYVAYGGTAIGAVRHGGFIPWDDDVDVCMPRADYDRFLAEAPALLGDEYELLGAHNHPDYPKTFAILGLSGTEFVPGVARERTFRIPIGVDLFPLDNMPANEADFVKQARSTWFWGRLLFLRDTPRANLHLPLPFSAVAGAAMYCIHHGLRLMRVRRSSLYSRWERAATRYDDQAVQWLADYSTQNPKRWSVRRDELFPAVDAFFEDLTIKIPRDVDAVLSRGFGDYMQLPRPEDRVNHEPYRVDFGEFEA